MLSVPEPSGRRTDSGLSGGSTQDPPWSFRLEDKDLLWLFLDSFALFTFVREKIWLAEVWALRKD